MSKNAKVSLWPPMKRLGNVIKERISTDLTSLGQTTATIYVATTGNDTTGTGTVSNPYLTVQKGVNEASKLVNITSGVTVNIADGTYTENINTIYRPNNITLQGNDTTPSNVVIAASSASSPVLDVETAGGKVKVSGVKLQGATSSSAIYADDYAVLELGKVELYNNKYGLYVNNFSLVTFLTGYSGTSIDCNNISFSNSMFITRRSTVVCYQSITITNVDIGIYCNNLSSFTCSDVVTINITLSTTSDPYFSIVARNYSYLYLNGTFNLDGGVIDSNNGGIQVQMSKCDFVANSTINMSNSKYGISGAFFAVILEGNATVSYNYTNITTNIYLEHSCETNTVFDTTITWWSSFEGTIDHQIGFDDKYYQLIKQNDASYTFDSDVATDTVINKLTVTGYTAGHTNDVDKTGFQVDLVGNNNDTSGVYIAYDALYDAAGGTSTGTAYLCGSNFSQCFLAESGDVEFYQYDATIKGTRDSDGNGDNLTIQAANGYDSAAVARNGGILTFYGGAKANAGNDGYVKIGQGAFSPTHTLTDDDLGIVGQLEVDSMIYADGGLTGNVTGNCSGSSGSCTGNSGTVTNGIYTTTLNTLAPCILATVTEIDLKTEAQTTLYTVPAGKTLIIQEVLLINTAVDNVTTPGIVEIGFSPDYDNFIDNTTLNADFNVLGDVLHLKNNNNEINDNMPESTVIKLDVTTGSTATTHTVKAIVIGFLI